MTFLTQAALAALLAGSIGIAGLVPTYADSAAPATPAPSAATPQPDAAQPADSGPGRGNRWGMQDQRPMWHRGGGSPLLRLACSDRGAEALEIAFVRMKYELKLTATQQPLFDTLRTAAGIRGAEATVMDALGHFPMSENPAQFRRYIAPVLDDIRTRNGA